MKRDLEIFKQPSLFDSTVQIIVTFRNEEKESAVAPTGDDVPVVRDRLLCHMVKHTTGELLKIVEKLNPYEITETQREAYHLLKDRLANLHTGGDLRTIQMFVDDQKRNFPAIVPPPQHRLYRSCRMKIDFVLAVGEFASACSEPAEAGPPGGRTDGISVI